MAVHEQKTLKVNIDRRTVNNLSINMTDFES